MDRKNTFSEENYLKAIYNLSNGKDKGVSTNAIAGKVGARAPSVTDMLRKLAKKKLLSYKKYHGARLTKSGRDAALRIIRKHRLWELFLVEKLKFRWDEVHDIAEQLEHIQSAELDNRLEGFLHYPKNDPHGDPIPDRKGHMRSGERQMLAELTAGRRGMITGVRDSSPQFLKYLANMKIGLGTRIRVKQIYPYDFSLLLAVDDKQEFHVSEKVGKNLYVKRLR